MANNSLFINIAVTLSAVKIERKKDASGQFLPLDLDGWIDVGVVVLVDFYCIILYRYVDANIGVSADARSPSNWRLLHAFLRLVPCLHRNARGNGISLPSRWQKSALRKCGGVLLASDILVGPARWDQNFRRAAASTTLSALYDYPTLRSERDHIRAVRPINDFGGRLFKSTFMGAHLVQFPHPWLRHLPNR